MYAIGVDLGGTSIKAALVKRGEGIVHEARRPTEAEKGPSHVLDLIAGLIEETAGQVGLDKILGIGIGAPGAVELKRQTLAYPPNLPGWTIVDLEEEMHARLPRHVSVIVDNDANVAGLGSAFFGAGRAYDSFIMVTLGTGVGGAIIVNKKLFRGATGGAGEIGHVSIDYDGPPDNAGVRGAIEGYLGNVFLVEHARRMLADHPESALYTMLDRDLDGLTPRHLYEAAQSGDVGAREVLAWAGHKLACVIGSAINLLDIRKIIIGGGISAAGDFILQPTREAVRSYVYTALRDGIEILQETLGNEAAVLGAAHLIFERADERASRLVV